MRELTKMEENRNKKYPNTHYFVYTNPNPKGKLGADCVIRAISIATGKDWETVVRELTELGIKNGMVLNDKQLFPKYLEQNGFRKVKEPRDYFGRKMTVVEAIKKGIIRPEDIVCMNAGTAHLSCIVNKKVRDTWDCSGKILHTFWIKMD